MIAICFHIGNAVDVVRKVNKVTQTRANRAKTNFDAVTISVLVLSEASFICTH